MAHYFDAKNTQSEQKLVDIKFFEDNFKFFSDNSVFSKNELDEGSKLLIDCFLKNISHSQQLECVDLGCCLTNKSLKFYYVDITERAVLLTQKNLMLFNMQGNTFVSDCLDAVKHKKYDVVISNPPIRAGNGVLFRMFQESFDILKKGGKFVCVLRIKQGAKTYIKKIWIINKNSSIR